MASVFRRTYHPLTWLALSSLALAGGALLAWQAIAGLSRLDPVKHDIPATVGSGTVSFPNAVPLTALHELPVMRAPHGVSDPVATTEDLTQRFRLAGTFFVFETGFDPATRKAVLVDRKARADHIVQEGDRIDNIGVVRVAHDHVMLEHNGRYETLGLSTGAVIPSGAGTAGAVPKDGSRHETVHESRFGDQIGNNRWVFERNRLIDYYQDVMGSPRRLKQVFDSMKPLYDSEGQITGYTLDIEGEAGFFRDVGLRQGDVVRHVNSITMSNRRRAEYLIGEFIHDRLNVFVLDIERGGEPVQLIYEIR